jgi:hypothetical protein
LFELLICLLLKIISFDHLFFLKNSLHRFHLPKLKRLCRAANAFFKKMNALHGENRRMLALSAA